MSLKIKKCAHGRGGFTLIELLVVIAIIGLLSSIVLASLNTARAKARDAKRILEIQTVETALEQYALANNGSYPDSDSINPITDPGGCGGWDIGNVDHPFLTGRMTGILDNAPRDTRSGDCVSNGYFYYRYVAGTSGCPVSWGNFYILGVILEAPSGGLVLPNQCNSPAQDPSWNYNTWNWGGYEKYKFENH